MKFLLQKKTYAIIAALLLIAAISIASTKPESPEDSLEALIEEYEASNIEESNYTNESALNI